MGDETKVSCPACGTEIAADMNAEKCFNCGGDVSKAEEKKEESAPVAESATGSEDDSLPVNEKLPESEPEVPVSEASAESVPESVPEQPAGEVVSDPVSE